MESDLVRLNSTTDQRTAYIPLERDQLEERENDTSKHVVLSMRKLPPDRNPVPRPYQSGE